MEKRSAYDFFVKDYQQYGIDKYNRPLLAQNEGAGLMTMDKLKYIPPYSKTGKGEFIHCFPHGEVGEGRDKIDCRLYINFKSGNLLDFINEFIGKCVKSKEKIPYFKFYTKTDNRNDNFLIYTSYEKAEQIITLLEQIKKEHPELFSGTEKVSKNMGTINGWIGYGDEPTKEMTKTLGGSYNSTRENLTDDFISDTKRNPKFANLLDRNGKLTYSETVYRLYINELYKNGIEPNFCANIGTPKKVQDIYRRKAASQQNTQPNTQQNIQQSTQQNTQQSIRHPA
jgi:hypothetical protein